MWLSQAGTSGYRLKGDERELVCEGAWEQCSLYTHLVCQVAEEMSYAGKVEPVCEAELDLCQGIRSRRKSLDVQLGRREAFKCWEEIVGSSVLLWRCGPHQTCAGTITSSFGCGCVSATVVHSTWPIHIPIPYPHHLWRRNILQWGGKSCWAQHRVSHS